MEKQMLSYFTSPLITLSVIGFLTVTLTPITRAGDKQQTSLIDQPNDTGGSRDPLLKTSNKQTPQEAVNRGKRSLPKPNKQPSKNAKRILNINFGMHPRDVPPGGVVGGPHDVWTLIDVGETTKKNLPMADGTSTKVCLRLSENDGEWGIPGAFDIYHAYLYHNARDVDLTLTLHNLPTGRYNVFVFAHGAAPEQNAAIEISTGDEVYKGKATINDGSMSFLSRKHKAGVQYVRYTIDVNKRKPVTIISYRDGSDLSMFNAIQLMRTDTSTRKRGN